MKTVGCLRLHEQLYQKYSSSQTYFYTNAINEIIKERRTAINIFYEDVEYLCDQEENLKRWYASRQFDNKMFTFKEYYFYHEDCPRIFMKGIEESYSKWQDRKRDLVYKKLKMIYNESYSSRSDDSKANEDQKSQNYVAVSHFLLEISDYNPYSKKYYLRVEDKKEREKYQRKVEVKNTSKRDLSNLNHELSLMLNDISQLSILSIRENQHTPKKLEIYKSQKLNTQPKRIDFSSKISTTVSNSNSLIRFNFKKNKDSAEKLIDLKNNHQTNRKSQEALLQIAPNRVSPKFSSNQHEAQLLKSKSIFSVSSFGTIQFKKTDSNINVKREREQLRLNYQPKQLSQSKNDHKNKRYESEKKRDNSKNVITKTKSTVKLEPTKSVAKIKIRQISVGKQRNSDEFSDKKMTEGVEYRMRSIKSEITASSSGKQALLNSNNGNNQMQNVKGKRKYEM